ncbi:unnamed protein product [Triticum turgidum subsp. durum]|uniref:BZIP domain-containing protein n=1 Tax=Triticum turgidum subsp. durum TaxID=4567 RepID=A0A9R0XDF8_TRITD|nr:unnamed protein product [Triticum turgidum subsp. durum]
MNKDRSRISADGGGGDGLPPQPSRRSSTPPPEYDISRMPDFPTRNPGHRRAHSEILSLPDDLDLCAPGGGDGPSLSDENDEELFSMFLDVDKLNSSCGPSSDLVGAPGMEGMSTVEAKKAVSAAKLAELALVDPKRAKRIWANRQSAARSKERKMRYIGELERKVQTLQTEATTLSAQLSLLQRDTSGLTSENSELKIRLQNMEQQVHLQDALNDTLKTEVQRLKVATGQMGNGGGMLMNYGGMSQAPHQFGSNQQMFHNSQSMQSLLATHQLQQLQLHQQPQQQQQPMRPQHHHHQQQQPLHPLQAQQFQQAARDLKMKGPMWGDGKSSGGGGI